jgi:hypothetical protein
MHYKVHDVVKTVSTDKKFFNLKSVSRVCHLVVNLSRKHTVPLNSRFSVTASINFPLVPLCQVLYTSSITSTLCTAVSTQNSVQSDTIYSHAQNTTAFRCNIFSIETQRMLIMHI